MLNRFSRQMKIGWWNQKKINNTNIMIVGCGGIGCWTAIQMTFIGIRKIILVDMDNVEESNLNRQMFFQEDIKRPKVEALRDKITKINPTVKVEAHKKAIEELDSGYFENVQFVFDCLDNIKTREYISKLCWDKKIPFIHSACSESIGEVQLCVNGKTKPMREYEQNMKDNEDKRSCKDFDASVCTTNMIVASLQVDKFLDYIIKGDVSKPFTSYIRGRGITFG